MVNGHQLPPPERPAILIPTTSGQRVLLLADTIIGFREIGVRVESGEGPPVVKPGVVILTTGGYTDIVVFGDIPGVQAKIGELVSQAMDAAPKLLDAFGGWARG